MDDEIQPNDVKPADDNTLRNRLIAGGIAVAAVVGGAIYVNSSDPVWSDAEKQIAAPALGAAPVEPVPKAAVKAETALEARGVIAAKQESTIASKMTARITEMPFGKGRSFRKGALLARFDCSATRAQLAAARASANAYQVSYNTNVELDQYEAIGKNEVAVSRANLGKAQAEASAIEAQLSDCAVYAPFSGTVVEEIAHRGEVAASGQPLLIIQSGGDLEAELIVPSNWLTWLRPGAAYRFVIDETGAEITGSITSLGASVDPVSKTIRVTGRIGGSDSLVLPGMSGTATFEKPQPAPAVTPTAAATQQPAAAKPKATSGNGQ